MSVVPSTLVLLKWLFYGKHLWSGPDKERTAPSLYIAKVQGHVCLPISARKVNFFQNKGVVVKKIIFPKNSQKDFFLKIMEIFKARSCNKRRQISWVKLVHAWFRVTGVGRLWWNEVTLSLKGIAVIWNR